MDKQKAMEELRELQARAKALEEIIKAPDVPEVVHGIVYKPSGYEPNVYNIDLYGKAQNYHGSCEELRPLGLDFVSREAVCYFMEYMRVVHKARLATQADWVGPINVNNVREVYAIRFDVTRKVFCVVRRDYMTQLAFCTKSAAEAFMSSLSKRELALLVFGMEGFDNPSIQALV